MKSFKVYVTNVSTLHLPVAYLLSTTICCLSLYDLNVTSCCNISWFWLLKNWTIWLVSSA